MQNSPIGSFDGRLAVVTGGVGGIGRAIATDLSNRGVEVHVLDPAEVSDAPAGIEFHRVDITDTAAINAVIDALPAPVDFLVNNAGITRDRSLSKMSDIEWDEVIEVNLSAAFRLLRAVSTSMKAAKFGRIVNITSINGLRGKFGQANYAASKAGLIGLTKTAARELGRHGVTVNAVAPGMVLTEMALQLPAEYRDAALAESALKQLAEPRDIAAAVAFLLSDEARMITGQVLQVDAGQYI